MTMTTFALRRRLNDALSSPVVSVAVILVMTAGAMMAATQADGYFVFIIALVAINVIVAVGLNVLWGLSGQISFGHVGFFAIGAYTTAIAMNAGWSFWLALPAAGVPASAALVRSRTTLMRARIHTAGRSCDSRWIISRRPRQPLQSCMHSSQNGGDWVTLAPCDRCA